MDNVPVLSRIVPELRVKVCLDHFASPDLRAFKGRESSFDPYSLCGFSELITLLRQGNTYVKISGAYRLSADPEMQCVRAMARELMSVAPTRLVFATDWPHTQFDGLDIMPFIEECLSWSRAGSGLRERLFRRNAEELWDVQGTDENYAQRL
jgi:predicted TIM-barrel fold metal-dependent hydrolase